ncbi:HEPN domain-containing protein, partial [Nanoarchaeota archaeon NZ13-N]
EEYKTPAYVYYYAEKEGKLLWYSRVYEDVKNLLEMAMENLKVVDYLKSKEFYYHICLHCSWAVRDLLKAFLIFNQLNFSKPNDIVELVKLCMEFDRDFREEFQNYMDVFEKLKGYDILFKRSELFDVSKEEAQRIIEITERVKEFILNKIKLE